MKLMLLFIFLLSCEGSNIPVKVTVEKKTVQIQDKVETKGLCLDGIGASFGDQHKLEVLTKSGFKLILCGYSTSSEYDVYSINPKGELKLVKTFGALDNMQATIKNNTFYFNGSIAAGHDSGNAFRGKVICNTTECKFDGALVEKI